MPRSLQDIIDSAEALSRHAEEYEPTDAQMAYSRQLAGVHRQRLAIVKAEVALVDAIAVARRAGAPWKDIGAVLGTTDEAARQRYGKLVDRAQAS